MDDASPPVAWTLQTKCNMNNTKEGQNMKTQNFLNVAGLLYTAPKFCKVTRMCRLSQRISSRINNIFRTSLISIQDRKWENSYSDFQMRKDLMWKWDIIEQSMETHPEIDQVQQHTQQGCGSTCPPASCWGKNRNLQWPDGLYCTNFFYRRNIWPVSRAWSCAWTSGLLQTDARIYSVQQVQSFISKRTKLFRF